VIPTIEAVRAAAKAAVGICGPLLIFGMVSADGEDLEVEAVIAKRNTSVVEVRSAMHENYVREKGSEPPAGWNFFFKEVR
jgi:hypothetical protein